MNLSKKKVEIILADKLIKPTELSKKANITHVTFNRALNGFKIKPETAGKIAKALEVPVEQLLES